LYEQFLSAYLIYGAGHIHPYLVLCQFMITAQQQESLGIFCISVSVQSLQSDTKKFITTQAHAQNVNSRNTLMARAQEAHSSARP
jgi:hypothetical protein